MKTSLLPVLALVASGSFGCVVVTPAPAAPAPTPVAPATTVATPAATPATPAAPVTPVVPAQLSIRSECATAAALWIGLGDGKPGSPGGHHTQVNAMGSIMENRQSGKLSVWLLNSSTGAAISRVDATATTRDVVVDKSCQSFRAE